MSIEQNKELTRRLIEAMNASDYEAIDQIASPELAQEARAWVPWIYATHGPNHHMVITDMVAEDDRVYARLATSGSHTGVWQGIQPTGKEWTNTGVYFLRYADNKLVALDGLFDAVGLLKQLGGRIVGPE